MKTLYKNIGIATGVLFLISIIVVTYYTYTVSASIASVLQIREVKQLSLIEQVVNKSSLIIGLEIVLGGTSILSLLLANQAKPVQVINNEYSTVNNKQNIYSQKDSEVEEIYSKKIEAINEKLQASHLDKKTRLDKILAGICHELEACQGAVFYTKQTEGKRVLEMCASYAYFIAESKTITYEFGEGLTGQVVKEGRSLNISSVPEGYVTIISGLGKSSPKNLIIAPIVSYAGTVGVIEIASFKPFTNQDEAFLKELSTVLCDLLPAEFQEAIVN